VHNPAFLRRHLDHDQRQRQTRHDPIAPREVVARRFRPRRIFTDQSAIFQHGLKKRFIFRRIDPLKAAAQNADHRPALMQGPLRRRRVHAERESRDYKASMTRHLPRDLGRR